MVKVALTSILTAVIVSAFWIWFYNFVPGAAAADRRVTASGEKITIDPKAQPARRPAYAPDDLRQARSLRILVADDNDDGREMLGYLLTAEGHTVELAVDGPSAIETAGSFHPDVAILDIGMPGMNGYDVARALRTRFPEHGATLVALTGWGQEDDRQRARDAGFDHHLVKPADLDVLQHLLHSIEDCVRIPGSVTA